MNGWQLASIITATIIALGFTAWGVLFAWAVNGYTRMARGEYEIEDEESEDI